MTFDVLLYIIQIYFYFPETKGRSLEEMDVVFAKANAEGVSPVKMAFDMPHYEGHELERELARYFDGSSGGSPTDVEKAHTEKPDGAEASSSDSKDAQGGDSEKVAVNEKAQNFLFGSFCFGSLFFFIPF